MENLIDIRQIGASTIAGGYTEKWQIKSVISNWLRFTDITLTRIHDSVIIETGDTEKGKILIRHQHLNGLISILQHEAKNG
jgi:hypothetical protein